MINQCYRKRLDLRRRAIARKRWQDTKLVIKFFLVVGGLGYLLIHWGAP